MSYPRQGAGLSEGPPRTLVVCGHSGDLPDTESSMCANLQLEEALVGAGPVTLSIEGSVEVPPGDSPSPTYTAGSGQSSQVKTVWVNSFCHVAPRTGPVTQQVRGQLVLTENSATRFAGRLTLNEEGPVAGPCLDDASAFDVNFQVAR